MAVPHWIRIQLSGPKGLLARPMAHFFNRANASSYRRALDALGVSHGESVLELGFGGGVGVDALLERGIQVIASEPSESMRALAFRRWSRQLARGQLDIWPHTAEQLPANSVDRALSLNTVYFWHDIEAGFANLSRMVNRRVVLGIAEPAHLRRAGFEHEGFRIQPVEWYQERLAASGLICSVQAAPRRSAHSCALLVGEKPPYR